MFRWIMILSHPVWKKESRQIQHVDEIDRCSLLKTTKLIYFHCSSRKLLVELSEIFARSYDKFICFYNLIFCFSTEHRQSHIFLLIVKHFSALLSTYIIVIYEVLIRANENLITIIHIVWKMWYLPHFEHSLRIIIQNPNSTIDQRT